MRRKRKRNTRLDRAIGQGLAVFATPEPLTAWEWADRNFYLSPESSGTEGPWKTLPYQRAIMAAMASDDLDAVTVQKPKRVGYTKCLSAVAFYLTVEHRRSTVIYQPVDDDAAGFMREEVDPILRDCATVRAAATKDPDKKGPHSTVGQKSFLGAVLHVRGGKSARAYRRLTKDCVIYDELDGFDSDIDREGDPVILGDGRVEASPFAKSIRGSTPRVKHTSIIERLVGESDLVFFRWVRCQGCEALHQLEFRQMTFDSKAPPAELEATHACPECGYAAQYRELPAMDEGGAWMTKDGVYRVEDDGRVFHVERGNRTVVKAIAFKFWAALSYFKTWSAIAVEHVKAARAAERGRVEALKTFVNTVLGETWEDENMSVDAEDTAVRREGYDGDTLPDEVLRLTVGVDRQQNRLEAELVGWGLEEESWGVEPVVFWGDPMLPKVWADLDEWLKKPRTTVSGRVLRVSACGIDSSDEPDSVYQFTRGKWGRRVFALKGRAVERDRPIVSAPKMIKPGVRLFTIGSFAAKLLLFGRMQVEEPGPGYCHFSHAYPDKFFEQLEAERLSKRLVKGREVAEFVQVAKRNEAIDVRQYAIAALYVLGPPSRILRARAQTEPVEDARQEWRASRGEKPARGRRGGWASSWR